MDKYIYKSKSKANLDEEPNLIMYKMLGSDKLFTDSVFPLYRSYLRLKYNIYAALQAYRLT